MSNSILSFKTAYLQAVAKSWEDEVFAKEFHEKGEENILTFLEQHSGSPKDFISPWENLVINFLDDESHTLYWDPIQTGRWVGNDDRLTIFLPEDPGLDNRVEGLAQYNFIFPSFMGKVKSDMQLLFNDKEQIEFIDYLVSKGIKIPTILTLGETDMDLLSFSAVMLRTIALYWDDPSFKEEILNADGDHSDKAPVLSKFFGFSNPWNFAINFKECKTFILNKDDDSEFDYPANVISLGKPRKPQVPEGVKGAQGIYPIALAAYNDDGKSYPFTCC